MKRVGKIAVAALAVAASLFAVGSAKADTVNFGTYGTFAAGGLGNPDTVSNLPQTPGSASILAAGGGPGSLVLTFVGDPTTYNQISSPLGTPIVLGTFSLTGSGTAAFYAPGGVSQDTFTVNIVQTNPAGTPAVATPVPSYSVTGSVSTNAGVATIALTSPTITVLGANGHVFVYDLSSDVTITVGGSAPLSGLLLGPAGATTPLPKAALGGAGLLGLMVIRKSKREATIA